MKNISIGSNKLNQKLKPIWHKLMTAGRANEGLRANWQQQLREIQKEIGFEYIRFHGLLCDEMAILLRDEEGKTQYNFTYVDELFDFLLSINVRPFVEWGFMPTVLADGEKTIFWWKGNISMPKVMIQWEELIERCMSHWITRYGKEEVLKWYFEVWNEPNLQDIFFDGNIEDYMKLYGHTVSVIKSFDKNFKVGGPAASGSVSGETPWITEFLQFCYEANYPVDFISCHPYPNNYQLDGYGGCIEGYRDAQGTPRELAWIKGVIEQSHYPNVELHITEWNSSPNSRDLVHDTAFMAPFIIKNNLASMELTDSLGYWAFSDVFEEKPPSGQMFHGGFGLINKNGIKKAGYWGYWFLAQLGSEVLEQGEDYIVTKSDRGYQILVYNYVHYTKEFEKGAKDSIEYCNRYNVFLEGEIKKYSFEVEEIQNKTCVIKQYKLDRESGSAYDMWLANGALEYPDESEMNILIQLSKPEVSMSKHEQVEFYREIEVQPHGVVLIDIQIKE